MESSKSFQHPVLGVIHGYSCLEDYESALKNWETMRTAQVPPDELPCLREREDITHYGDVAPWTCVNDHTGCLYNDGHNGCNHDGDSHQPLEDKCTAPSVRKPN